MHTPATTQDSADPLRSPLRTTRPQLVMGIVLLALLVMVTYSAAMKAGFIWDDDDYITNNQTLRSFDGLRRIWFEPGATPQYYPLVFTTFWIECRLWGLRPAGYHIINIALHALNAALLWFLLQRLGIAGSAVAAWLIAAVFALHPVHVESVAWVSERKNVLSAAMYLAAFLAYLRFDQALQSQSRNAWKHYAVVLLLFLAALFSKTVTCSLPAAILLTIWWKRGRIRLGEVAIASPMFLLSLAFAAMTIWMERTHVGARGDEWSLNFADRCILAGRNVWFYAQKLVWPTDLAFIYPRWQVEQFDWRWWMFPLSIIGILIALYAFRNRIGRGPLAALLFFIGTLTPALGFIDVYPFRFSFVADHFQYLASVGLIVLVLGTLWQLMPRQTLAFGVIVALALSVQSWRQTHIYRDLETLWRDTLAKNPESFMPHFNLGNLLLERGDKEQALQQYRRALEIKPNLTPALNSIGMEFARQKQYEPAIEYFTRAINSQPNYVLALQGDPNAMIDRWLIEALFGLGRVHGQLRNLDEAIHYLSLAVALDSQPPTLVEPRIDLAVALFMKDPGNPWEPLLLDALEIEPLNQRARSTLETLRRQSLR
jgi:protein O-mannosyl-transferase